MQLYITIVHKLKNPQVPDYRFLLITLFRWYPETYA